MNIPIQIDSVSIARATNAAHYEYLATVMRRVEEIPIENDLWRKAVDEFRRAFTDEDKAFKKYSASLKTATLRDADAERDRLYASLRDAVKAFAKFPIAEMSQTAEPLLRIIKNYRINTAENYMKESGNIENLLQDMSVYRDQLRLLKLDSVVAQLKTKNDEVRRLIAERNEERGDVVLGELAAARRVSDRAYAAVVFYTNAYFAMNPDRREAEDLVKRMDEDLEYFRKHAMNTSGGKRQTPEADTDAPAEVAEG